MFKKYSEYKSSGVDWLGLIPKDWQCVRMKHLYGDHSEKNKQNQELLSVTQSQGVVPRAWVEKRVVMPSGNLESFKFIRKGDFAISLRSFEGGLEYCHHDGIISREYTVLKAKRRLESSYYRYLFKSISFIAELQIRVVGIREGKIIRYEELSQSFLPVPGLSEQTAVANFLDRKTAEIDQAISIKEKQLELLKERRQILIHNAVTRGLDPDMKMKDSGVSWIGEVPEHWEVVPVKRIIEVRDGTHETPEYVEEADNTFPMITSKDFEGDVINFRNAKWISEKDHIEIAKRSGVQCGDVLMSMIGGNIGKSVIIDIDDKFSIKNVALFKTRNNKCLAQFLRYFFESGLLKKQIDMKSRGGAQEFLSLGDIRNPIFFKIPTKELARITKYLNELAYQKTAPAISLKQKEIEKLKEYKSTLINSAVTGKIKVN